MIAQIEAHENVKGSGERTFSTTTQPPHKYYSLLKMGHTKQPREREGVG
jgi:hypothetical protein